MTRRADPIRKVVLKDGSVRYRFVIDVGEKPKIDRLTKRPVLDAAGEPVMMRDQRTYTYTTKREAQTERARIVADKSRGTFVAPNKATLAEHLTAWLDGKRDVKASTLGNYRNALKPALEALGHVPLQQLTKAHVDRLVNTMLTSGRRVGTRGRPLSASTVNLMLTVLAMGLDDAVQQGAVVRNVARLVKRPAMKPGEMATWTAEQAGAFLAYVAGDRLAVAWQLSLYGMRRGEVLGLRWSDIDLTGRLARERDLADGTPSLAIRVTRTIVEGRVVEGEPKTERGKRVLPLDTGTVDALTAFQLHQRDEAELAGAAYGRCPDCAEQHVVVDALGDPVHPESYSDRFEVLVRKAGLPAIRLHDTRHTCGTLMHLRGVKTAVISEWLGHASAAFTMRTYVHSQAEEKTKAGATLAAAYIPQPRSEA